jgi:hypothetical protein
VLQQQHRLLEMALVLRPRQQLAVVLWDVVTGVPQKRKRCSTVSSWPLHVTCYFLLAKQ